MNKKMKKFNLYLIAILIMTGLPMLKAVQAKQPSAGDLIKFRQSAMMFMRWNMGQIKKNVIVKPDSFNRNDVMAAARVIAAIANANMHKLYPVSTKTGKGWAETRVKEKYFTDKEDVKEKQFAFVEASDELLVIASSGSVDQIRAKFKGLLNSCKSCHKAYRKKK